MTELLIDGQAVVLPKGFNITVKRENPFITKNGEYTYDVTLDLDNPTNAQLYKHLNRLNSVLDIKEKRAAVLIADNRVYCNGTEVITGWTQDTVTIQIASGNSELNYVIGKDLQISSLKMRITDQIEPDNVNYIKKTYPEVDYCLPPLVDTTNNRIINKWSLSTRKYPEEELILNQDGTYWYAQPYLCAYLKELLRSLNYELTLNEIESTPFKDLYICNAEGTNDWSKMLPGWSVLDFLEQIEALFNVVVVVDNRQRSVRVLFENSYYQGVACSHVRQVTDVYEVELENEPEKDMHIMSNVHYKFPDSAYWRWRCLPDNLLKEAKRGTIPADYVPQSYGRIQEWFMDEAHKLNDTIFTDEGDGREYLYLKNLDGWQNQPVYVMLNEFAPLKRKEEAHSIELEIMPAEMGVAGMSSYSNGTPFEDLNIFVPTLGSKTSSKEGEETDGLPDWIEKNIKKDNSESKENIYLAFFSGLAEMKTLGGLKRYFPIPYTDEYRADGYGSIPEYYRTNNSGVSLRLITLDKFFYQGIYDIDFSKGVKINSYDPNLFDPRRIFEIRNKRYICKEMEYTLDASGRKGAWQGTFYPIKISDTEADARWILSDGKWRDGGVWMDNGRWLD